VSDIIHIEIVHKTGQKILFLHTFFFIKITEVTFVFFSRVFECDNSVLMKFHAELNSFLESNLWLITCVNVLDLFGLHIFFIVINSCIDDSISNSLSNNLFTLFN